MEMDVFFLCFYVCMYFVLFMFLFFMYSYGNNTCRVGTAVMEASLLRCLRVSNVSVSLGSVVYGCCV